MKQKLSGHLGSRDRLARSSINGGGHDGADQVLDIVAVRAEVGNEPIHQGLITCRIGGTEVVFGIDQTATEEVSPDPIDHGSGEVRIVGPREPLGKSLAAIGSGFDRQGRGIERLRCHQRAGARVVHLAVGGRHHDHFACCAGVLEADPGKEACHAIILVLCPLLHGVIVTAGTRQGKPEERHARAFREIDRVAMQDEVIRPRW